MILQRFIHSTHGTFGTLVGLTKSPLYTCEEENHGNAPSISCIPAGVYRCVRTHYHGGNYATFVITGVSGRPRILFHRGNSEEDTAGCVLLGVGFGTLMVRDEDTGVRGRKLAVLRSVDAFEMFMHKLEGVDEFTLSVEAPKI